MPRLYNGMTEGEILAAGKTFSLGAPEVARRRAGVKAALDKVNNATWDDAGECDACLRSVFGEVGESFFFLEPVSFVAGRNIFFGDNVFLNANVSFIDVAPIRIGDHAMIAPGCVLTTVDHPKSPAARRGFTSFATPITVGRDVWIGANCTVLPGLQS